MGMFDQGYCYKLDIIDWVTICVYCTIDHVFSSLLIVINSAYGVTSSKLCFRFLFPYSLYNNQGTQFNLPLLAFLLIPSIQISVKPGMSPTSKILTKTRKNKQIHWFETMFIPL